MTCDVHNQLRRAREQNGWSQRQLARAAGMHHPTINSIETGKRVPTLHTMRRLARALHVEIADLL
ncbi:MAG: helix-turn-helix transcriptional regulator [Patescibacteria group bacterium]